MVLKEARSVYVVMYSKLVYEALIVAINISWDNFSVVVILYMKTLNIYDLFSYEFWEDQNVANLCVVVKT